jgi:hypothetical protein
VTAPSGRDKPRADEIALWNDLAAFEAGARERGWPEEVIERRLQLFGELRIEQIVQRRMRRRLNQY